MCRIASPFLLQRLKGSMSGGARSLVAVVCFLPGRAKDLSAPPHKNVYLRTMDCSVPSLLNLPGCCDQNFSDHLV